MLNGMILESIYHQKSIQFSFIESESQRTLSSKIILSNCLIEIGEITPIVRIVSYFGDASSAWWYAIVTRRNKMGKVVFCWHFIIYSKTMLLSNALILCHTLYMALCHAFQVLCCCAHNFYGYCCLEVFTK